MLPERRSQTRQRTQKGVLHHLFPVPLKYSTSPPLPPRICPSYVYAQCVQVYARSTKTPTSCEFSRVSHIERIRSLLET